MGLIIGNFFGSLIAGWIMVGLVRRGAIRRGLMDLPNARSSHVAPTPRGGGIAIVVLTLAAVALGVFERWLPDSLSIAWLVGGGLVACVGFLDDLRGLSPLIRACIHIAAALLLINAVDLPGLQASIGMAGVPPGLFWLLLGMMIVWSINLFNFMDGIDGLASAQCVFVVVAGVALMARHHLTDSAMLPCVAMAGATAGFLCWNAPPAKIFMGDVGSGFIGFGLATGALVSSGQGPVSLWTWVILNGLFLVDSTVTLLTRLLRGERIFQPHRSHAYQRLARRWSSHRLGTFAFMAVNVAWCLPWAVVTTISPGNAALAALAAMLPLCVVAIAAGAGRTEQ